ncbi:pentapeptide repeat-containing protein [Trichothermofontia sp.]
MANPEHLAQLRQGVTHWNHWRSQHPNIVPDLRGPSLPGGVTFSLQALFTYLDRLTQVGILSVVLVLCLGGLRSAIVPKAVVVLFLVNQFLLLGLLVGAIAVPLAIVGWAMQMAFSVWQGHDLHHLSLQGVNLSQAKLMGANLDGLDLRSVNLYAADLRFAHLRQANLSRANLSRANLFLADLQGANLSHANLTQSCLIWTNLDGANLKGAVLREAICSLANFHAAKFSHTVMPNGTLRDR